MEIEYIWGDLFETEIRTIIHGCNCRGVMGSGIAKLVKNKYPQSYVEYKAVCDFYNNDPAQLLGDIVVYTDPNGLVIVNAFTQNFYGRDRRYADYDAIRKCMQKTQLLFNGKIDKIAMPRIGAGLGGGGWDIIEKIIEEELTTIKPYVYVF